MRQAACGTVPPSAFALELGGDALGRDRSPTWSDRPRVRFGIDSGPMLAGVVGRRKFQYDLWGDAVNCASRMELHSEPGRLHISSDTWKHVRHAFACTSRGRIAIEGMGEMETFFVDRALAPRAPMATRSGRAANSLGDGAETQGQSDIDSRRSS
ncbi:MAG: hypothetical protein H6648_00095 [Caldilineae bacterium]|nr:hypothetical protein [Caldilineae bacterium]